jgi:Ca2+-binding EF-hand superfamily protein
MKSPGLTLPLLSATLFLFVGTRGPAQETMNATPAAKAAQRSQDLLKRYDKNGDGKLDDDERADAKEEMMKEQIDKQMVRTAAAAEGTEAFRARVLEFFDLNRDGRLDEEERAAAQKFAEDRAAGPEAARTAIREELMKRFDKNANGRIDPEEREGLQDFLRSQGNAVPPVAPTERREDLTLETVLRNAVVADPAQRERFDRDRDGKLSDEEWRAARPLLMRALGPTPGVMASSAQEKERLQRVAEEVARRRKLREETGQAVSMPPPK